MKVKLLTDGGYGSLAGINFPVEVEARFDVGVEDNTAIYVSCSELVAAGGDPCVLDQGDKRDFVDDEFEVVDE